MISFKCELLREDDICERIFNVPENHQIDIIYNYGCNIKIENQKVLISSLNCNQGKKNSCFVNILNKSDKDKGGLLIFLKDNEIISKNNYIICNNEIDCNNPLCYC